MKNIENTEIVITFAKIRDNVIRYWWIFGLGFLVACFIILSSDKRGENADTESANAELLFYYESQEKNSNGGEKDILAEILKKDSTTINYLDVSKMAEELMKTQESINEINEKMIEKGFANYKYNPYQSSLTSSERLIVCTISAASKEEVQILSEVYSEILLSKMNEMLRSEEVLLVRESDTDILEISSTGSQSGVLSVKNVFILCLCILFSLIIVFILMLNDKYFRCKNEIEQLRNVPLLGEICDFKNGWENNFILFNYLKQKNYNNMTLVSLGNEKKCEEILGKISGLCDDNLKKNVNYIKNVKNNLADLHESDEYVLLLNINKDKIPDVKKVTETIMLLEKKIIGVIYIG